MSGHIIGWCTEHSLDGRIANRVGVALEEMAVSTAHYAHHDAGKGAIDVFLHMTGEVLTVQMRDNGIAFNPVEYTAAALRTAFSS